MATLTLDQFQRIIKSEREDVKKMLNKTLPEQAGSKLVHFFHDNFRKGGYQDNGFHKWKDTKRRTMGFKGVDGKYGPLLSRRNALFRSIKAQPMNAAVLIKSELPYSDIHNNGGNITVPVTKKMKGYFWYQYYRNSGITSKTSAKTRKKKLANLNPIAEMWKAMALTKKKQLHITIPQRKFIYASPEVKGIVRDLLKKEVLKILRLK